MTTQAATRAVTDQLERRYVLAAAGATFRAEGPEDAELPRLAGVACPWDSLSVELWRDWETGKPVHERFIRKAFADFLATAPDIIVPRDHDPIHLLGRTSSGTAGVFESEAGLEYWVDPPPTEDGRTVVALTRRRDIVGSSFAFIPEVVSWREDETMVVRTVEKVKRLFDCSPVTWPAYPQSSVAARSLDDLQRELTTWRKGETAWLIATQRRLAQLAAAGL